MGYRHRSVCAGSKRAASSRHTRRARDEASRGNGDKGLYAGGPFLVPEVIRMGRPFKCPYCGATDTASKGVRPTKTMGVRRIRRCRACHRKFTPKNQSAAAVEEDSTNMTTAPVSGVQDASTGASVPPPSAT